MCYSTGAPLTTDKGRTMRALRAANYHEILLLLLATMCALLFLNAKGTDDVQVWLRWIAEMRAHGVPGGYARVAPDYPYPPLSFVALAAAAKGADWFALSERTAIKLTLLIALLVTSAVF